MSALLSGIVDREAIEKNFEEIDPLLTRAEAEFEASRCLFCYDAPCTRACPTHIDVPGFIKKIATGNLKGSARVILDANPIGSTCSRVCPVEVLCEGACVEKTLLKQPIQIGRLQRYAMDYILDGKSSPVTQLPDNGRSVAVVGAGPAGLSCASYLRRLGYEVTVYDRNPLPGGLATYGMAEYKMTQQQALAEAGLVEKMGVRFVVKTQAGVDISWAELEGRHQAIFLAVGLGATNQIGIPGEDLDGVYDALDFIRKVKTRDWGSVPIGKSVAVIGAGNTAIDAVTQARRLGAEKVYLVYRRRQVDMSAYPYEFDLAKQAEIEFRWLTQPVEVVADKNGKAVAGLKCRATRIVEDAASGRRKLEEVEGSEFLLAADMVIKATGQEKLRSFLSGISGIEIETDGRVRVDVKTLQTGNPHYFAGGDCVNGGAEVVDAAQQGKHAAMGIHLSLTGEEVRFAGA